MFAVIEKASGLYRLYGLYGAFIKRSILYILLSIAYINITEPKRYLLIYLNKGKIFYET